MLKKDTQYQHSEKMELANKLRLARKEVPLTMQHVADQAGLSVGFISQVERGITVPSLGSLVSIAKVLGKPVSFFLENESIGSELTRRGDRQSFEVAEGSVSYERLSTSFQNSKLHSVIIHEPPGHRMEPISHDGEELIFILQGEMSVEIEGEITLLRQGDSMHFDSTRIHAIWNHGVETTSVLWCGTLEIFGDGDPNPIHKKVS